MDVAQGHRFTSNRLEQWQKLDFLKGIFACTVFGDAFADRINLFQRKFAKLILYASLSAIATAREIIILQMEHDCTIALETRDSLHSEFRAFLHDRLGPPLPLHQARFQNRRVSL